MPIMLEDAVMPTGTDDPKPPFPADPSGEPPIEEPTETPPDREEPGSGDTATPGDAPMIA